jgi:hypothetical protein
MIAISLANRDLGRGPRSFLGCRLRTLEARGTKTIQGNIALYAIEKAGRLIGSPLDM